MINRNNRQFLSLFFTLLLKIIFHLVILCMLKLFNRFWTTRYYDKEHYNRINANLSTYQRVRVILSLTIAPSSKVNAMCNYPVDTTCVFNIIVHRFYCSRPLRGDVSRRNSFPTKLQRVRLFDNPQLQHKAEGNYQTTTTTSHT